MAGGEHYRRGLDSVHLAIGIMQADNSDNSTGFVGQERRDSRFFEFPNFKLLNLLAPSIHQKHAGLTLLVGRDIAYAAYTRNDVALIVAAEIKARLVEFRVEELSIHFPAFAR